MGSCGLSPPSGPACSDPHSYPGALKMAVLDDVRDVESVDMAWMLNAQCHGQAALFFPPLAERPDARMRRESAAKAICAQCPVLERCRTYGRSHHEYGVWGGENEEERVRAGYRLNAPVGVRKRPSVHSG
jgi:WhiB family transcriptional regulator, redox-sensing transcriptional regulator